MSALDREMRKLAEQGITITVTPADDAEPGEIAAAIKDSAERVGIYAEPGD